MSPVAIIVPIYKSTLTEGEAASFSQLIKVLGSYPVVLVCHEEMDTSNYLQMAEPHKISQRFFAKEYFKNVWTYSRLLISKEFYQRFSQYENILVYQLDAWVFKDELLFWCQQDYDYIGAPWYDGFAEAEQDAEFIGVGNGGFSLRKVRSHLRVLNSFSFVRSFEELKKKMYDKKKLTLKESLRLTREYMLANNTFHLLNQFDYNEDTFWGEFAPKRFKWFKTPDELTAARFSMEVKAPYLYKAVGNNLPFGCHAWEKYHTEFWDTFIHINNYQLG